MFRRVIAGLILGPALLIGSIAWSGFLALRTVFDEDRSRAIAEELLDNDEVRDQIAKNLGRAIEGALPESIEIPAEQVDVFASTVLADPTIESLILDSLGRTHAAFLGEGDAPQEIDLGPALAGARDQIVALAPALAESIPAELVVELPTERIPNASPVKRFLERTVPLLAAIAVVGVLLAFLTTSDRPSVLRRAARWAIGATAFYLIIGFGIPYFLRATAPDQAEVLAALLAALLRTTLLPSIALGVAGAALLVASWVWPERGRVREQRAAPAPAPASMPSPAHPRAVAAPPPSQPTRTTPQPTGRTVDPTTPLTTRPAATPAPPVRPAPPPATPARPVRSTEPPPAPAPPAPAPVRPTLPTRAKPPDAAELPGWTGEQATGAAGGSDPVAADETRPPRWLPPTWVEGHGWVMDPDDEREPPGNARFVEGVGWVVPGPPP